MLIIVIKYHPTSSIDTLNITKYKKPNKNLIIVKAISYVDYRDPTPSNIFYRYIEYKKL